MKRPFSVLYYIKENKLRVVALMIMLSMTSISYLAGLFIISPRYESMNTLGVFKDFAVVILSDNANEQELEGFLGYLDGGIPGIGCSMDIRYFAESGNLSGMKFFRHDQKMLFDSLIGVPIGLPMPVFLNSNDFSAFNKVMKLVDEDVLLGDGQIVMSEILRVNRGFEIGDLVDNDLVMVVGFKQSCELVGTYNSQGYTHFRVDSTYTPDSVLLLRENIYDKDLSIANFDQAVMKIKEKFPSLVIIDFDQRSEYVSTVLSTYYWVFSYSIAIIVAIVLTITINATFAGEYEKRKFEFSLYKAIGFSVNEIVAKIAKEILAIYAMGLILAGILGLTVLLTLNEVFLKGYGMRIEYFSTEAVVCVAICETIVLVSVSSIQLSRVAKCDVTQF